MSDVVGEVEAWSVGGTIESAGDLEALEWLPPLDELNDHSKSAAGFAVQVLRDAASQGLLEGRHDVRLYGHADGGLSISAWPGVAPEDEVPGPEHTEPVIVEDGVQVSPPVDGDAAPVDEPAAEEPAPTA